MIEKGTISINAENIMPVIKKWLYSDKDIFVREMISNGCDAISKYKRLTVSGDAPIDEPYEIHVTANEELGTLEFSDNGIGMTAEEVKRYIAQVAFSGAEEFLKKYEPTDGASGIIGHFGLGFYSVFMVSSKVEIDTKSYIAGEPAVKWTSVDGMEYDMEESEREKRGTTITLHLNDEDKEFLSEWTLKATLEKYCSFMPVPIFVEVIKPLKEGEEQKQPEQINEVNPLWLKRPNEVTDEEYKEFYRKVFRDYDEPLFWIHLNAEYPFNLKGILYFPRIKNEFSVNEGVIKLYNNQVFVADNIKEVIPEFLMLLKGVIDCPDLPLNVSRSFLQNDGYVKKMSAYITRKVADRLVNEFNTKREDYQKYWDDIHPFVKFGAIRDEKFYERVKPALIFKTTAGEYLTLEEYKQRNCPEGDVTVCYTSDEKRQSQMIKLFTDQGKDVVVLDSLIDNNFMSFLEYADKDEKLSFKRVDAGAEGLTDEGEAADDERADLEAKFRKAVSDDTLEVKLMPFKANDMIAMMTVEEQSRRFSDMSRQWGRGDMGIPEKRTLLLNDKHPLVNWLKRTEESEKLDMVCAQVADLAEMARQPLVADRMVEFLRRSNELMSMLVE